MGDPDKFNNVVFKKQANSIIIEFYPIWILKPDNFFRFDKSDNFSENSTSSIMSIIFNFIQESLRYLYVY